MRFSLGLLAAGSALLLLLPPLVGAAATNTTRRVTPDSLHSLPESYHFDPKDGWESVMVTNLRYKYRRSNDPSPDVTSPVARAKSSTNPLKRPSSSNDGVPSTGSVLKTVGDAVTKLTASIIAIGEPQPVTITWYTGKDLLNPSCWSDPKWAPTDQSFVAAVTEDGWSEKPGCFKFLELCNNSKNCTFVRVVDSCAGCQKGSKHVDLTQAAFEKLASLDVGVLKVQMREASDPTDWSEELWGPKMI